ncbi:MAG: hypothetical protein Q8N04_12395 [Nitrospira sp.]|nr:hypothetical protein [Nitrospira sp.]
MFITQPTGELMRLNKTEYDSEKMLQSLLANYPDILASEAQSGASRKWMLVKQELGIPDSRDGKDRWFLDHLFLDQEGIPTFVEVKREADSRIYREIVGQMLEYVANADAYWQPDHIKQVFQAQCQAKGLDESDELETKLGVEDPHEFWNNVEKNRRAGQVRLVFVADVIPQRLQRVVEFLNGQTDPAEIFAIEVGQYTDEHQKIRILAPKIIGNTPKAQSVKNHDDRPNTWPEALAQIQNEDVRKFFLEESERCKNNPAIKGAPALKKIYYECQRLRRWRILANQSDVNVYQQMRFEDDLSFWKRRFPNIQIRTTDDHKQLSFNLSRREELDLFRRVIEKEGPKLNFLPRSKAGDPA